RVMQQLGISADLPAGEKGEELETIPSRTPSNPGPRTPGRSTDPQGAARRSSPPRAPAGTRPRPSVPGRTSTRPQPRTSQPEEQPTLPATAAEKSRAPLLAAAAIVLGVLGVAGYLVQKSLTAAQEAKFAADEAMKARSIAAAAAPPSRAETPPQAERVFVVVVSDPL